MSTWQCGVCGACLACASTWKPTPPAHLARATDPATSHRAAARASMRTGSHKALLLAVYGRHGALSDAAAAQLAGLDHTRSWWKRCSDLRNEGFIAPCGHTTVRGERVMVCDITQTGRSMLELLGGNRGA